VTNDLTRSTYGHVIDDELEEQPRVGAEDAMLAARHGQDVRTGRGP
jgi:hypothetical protein